MASIGHALDVNSSRDKLIFHLDHSNERRLNESGIDHELAMDDEPSIVVFARLRFCWRALFEPDQDVPDQVKVSCEWVNFGAHTPDKGTLGAVLQGHLSVLIGGAL